MAVQSIVVTVNQAIPGGFRTSGANGGDQVANLATINSDLATVTTDLGAYDTLAATVVSTLVTLVADGASPTQAHVTAVNNAYTALKAAYVTLKADTNTAIAAASATRLSGNFTMLIDLAVVTSVNAVKAAIAQALQVLAGSGTLT